MTQRSIRSSAIFAACILLMLGPAAAQTTGNITIDGTFVPPSCSLTITGGGTFDYGVMTRATVLAYPNYMSAAQKRLPIKTATLNVNCPNAAVVALNWADNRASSRLAVDAYDNTRYGIANSNSAGQLLGGYSVALSQPTSSTGGATNTSFYQPSSGGAWTATLPFSVWAGAIWTAPNYVIAFGRSATSSTEPTALLDFSTTLSVEPYLSTTVVTNSTSSIIMDGSATVTLKYF